MAVRWALLALALLGCDDDAGEVTEADAGASDGALEADAGEPSDTGAPDLDATSLPDAAPMPDAAPRPDAAPMPDAEPMPPADLGFEPDGAPDAAPLPPRDFFAEYPLAVLHPEGGIYDPIDHAFYTGSLWDGSVHRVDADTGAEVAWFIPEEPGEWWTLGLAIDADRRMLYACAMDDRREQDDEDPPYDGYVWAFDLVEGERTAVYDLADARADATCTDVTVTEAGVVYVVDRENPRIYRIDTEGDGEVELFVDDDLLNGRVIGQNAVVTLPDQSGLLSVVYLPSRLVHIALPGGELTEVDIDGDFFDGLPPLSGADGMAWSDGGVLVAFTSQLNRVTPTRDDWSEARSESVDVPSGMTDVVVTPGGAYLLNGQAVDFAFDLDLDPFRLLRFDGGF